MKKDLHPKNYRLVVFEDTSNGFRFLTRSTADSEETIKWEDGNEYPLVKTHISSQSHPFYTGKEKVLDLEGRVDRFKAKAAKAAAHKKSKSEGKKHTSGKTEEPSKEVVKIGSGKAPKDLTKDKA